MTTPQQPIFESSYEDDYIKNLLDSYCDITSVLGTGVNGIDDKDMYLIDVDLLKMIIVKYNKYMDLKKPNISSI